MDIKRFAIGLILILGVFALKAGVGLYCGIISRKSNISKVFLGAGYSVVYLLLFSSFAYFWKSGLWSSKLGILLDVAKFGGDIHFTASVGLIVWAIWLLKSSSDGKSFSKAWIALVVPCPVCMTVIFFTMGFIVSYFPASLWQTVWVSWGFFIFTGIITSSVIGIFHKRFHDLNYDHMVAYVMFISASYTLLTLLFGTGVKEASRVFRIVASKNLIPGNTDYKIVMTTLAICLTTFLASFAFSIIKQNRLMRKPLRETQK